MADEKPEDDGTAVGTDPIRKALDASERAGRVDQDDIAVAADDGGLSALAQKASLANADDPAGE